MAKRKQPNVATRMPTESSAGRFRDRIVELRRVRCGDIEPHPLNPRLHPGKQLAAVSGLLVEVGKAAPLLAFPADGKGKSGDFSRLMYYDGHGRQIIDQNEVWPVIVTDLTRAEADKMVLSGDATVALAEYDPVKTRALMDQVETGCQELADMIADLWEDIQADAIADTEPADPVDAEPQTDRAAELQAKWGTAAGQLWLLGKHRLLCGDSTKPEDVWRVLDGCKPLLMVTDPPYGVEYEGGVVNERKREKLAGDETADLYHPALALSAKHMPSGAWYVWHAGRCAAPVYDAIESSGFEIRALLIWNKMKPHYGAPSAHYCQKHEPCLYAVRDNAGFCGPSNECTVWDIDQPSRNEHHPTQKPLECMARLIRNHEAPEVYDPFLGSGTTLIAAENLGRRCFGLEISPAYCAVILQRYQDAFPDQEIRQQD